MKAVLLHEHGGPEVLEYGDFPTPQPGPGQALVRLQAAALNRLDLWARVGWPGIRLEYPHILGADGAGEVAEVGPGVEQWAPGAVRVRSPSGVVRVRSRSGMRTWAGSHDGRPRPCGRGARWKRGWR